MNSQNKIISWDKYLQKYKVPTVLKEDLLRPYFENLPLEEPILDLGCGSGYFSEIIALAGKKILGIDKNSDLVSLNGFTFKKMDILDFQSKTNFKTILLINILSVVPTSDRNKIIKKIYELLDKDGVAHILTTSQKLFASPINSDLIYFERLSEDKVHLKVKLIDGDYIEFDDYIVSENETREQINANNLEIIKEKEFKHPNMDKPVYILYIVKKK
jgi:2-polyprenyl-3-methyl-5-hydroxy-6-metoxy-1,4-benzoquinol methylase